MEWRSPMNDDKRLSETKAESESDVSLKIRRISHLQKVVRIRQHPDSDLNSVTSLHNYNKNLP